MPIYKQGGTQVNSDWNAVSGVEEILNKPTIQSFDQTLNTTDFVQFDSVFATDLVLADKLRGGSTTDISGEEAFLIEKVQGSNLDGAAAVIEHIWDNSTSGVPKALLINVTGQAANGDATLFEATYQGVRKFAIDKNGNLLSGQVGDASLTANVPLKNTANTFTTNQTFSGTANTAPSQTAASGASLITRDLEIPELLFQAYNIWAPFGAVSGCVAGGAVGTGASGASSNCRNGSTATGWGRSIISSTLTRGSGSGGSQALCSVPVAVSVIGNFDANSAGANSNGSVVRLMVGDTKLTATAPPFAGAAALTDRGFGAEFYWSTANSRAEVKLFAHNGATYVTSAGVAYNGDYRGVGSVILSSDGAGTIKLHGSTTAGSHSNLSRPTLLLTLSGGPSGANTYANGANFCISAHAISNGTTAPVTDVLYRFERGYIALNQTI